MIRIDNRTVQLSPAEEVASAEFEFLLDRGLGIYDAVDRIEIAHPGLDPKFYLYLRGDDDK